jgi:hypothetical protein
MKLEKKDVRATVVVGIAALFYVLWAFGIELPGLASVRATGIVVLAFGFIASVTAVVPAFEELVHGSRAYLALTATIGLVAAAAGVQMLLSSSGAGLTVMVLAMVALWLIATAHHSRLANGVPRTPRLHHG